MSNFTLTDRQIVQLQMARNLVVGVSKELEANNIITVDAQSGDLPDTRSTVVVSTFEGDPAASIHGHAEIQAGEFTIGLRHFHDGKSQYIDLPEDCDEVER